REREDLGEQRVLEPVAGDGPADQDPLEYALAGAGGGTGGGRHAGILRGRLGDPAIADTGLREDQRRRGRVVAELPPQGADVGAKVGGLRAVPLPPDLAEQPLVR